MFQEENRGVLSKSPENDARNEGLAPPYNTDAAAP